MKYLLIKFIQLYQKTLSPDHSWLKAKYPYGFCRFYPTCSEYAITALQKHGTIKGTALSVKRIIKCNPFVQPQIDKI
ncbi:MAG TPA: membrane protein insertion efficiency factor YidD [Candidatus Doudnabacteria bacterium]|nr:membrane protein insertion efficiency factor YidD [Candidatus Doudnabacteria bacterium]